MVCPFNEAMAKVAENEHKIRSSKRQSQSTTDLFRTTFTRTIILNLTYEVNPGFKPFTVLWYPKVRILHYNNDALNRGHLKCNFLSVWEGLMGVYS